MSFYKPIRRAVIDLSVMVKLPLVSSHILCVFILIKVSSCHYPTTPFKSSVLWHSLQHFKLKKKIKKKEELKVHDSDMSLLAQLPEIPHFKSLVEEDPFCTETKTFGL